MPTAMPRIIEGDITTLDVDAIVNAANEHLAPGGGVCGAIHRAAGPRLAAACAAVGGCPTGEARMTEGFDLSARFVIHAVGPVYDGGAAGEPALLAACYEACLALAADNDVASIAFPCISTGIFGYPRAEAAGIALGAILARLRRGASPGEVICCCFGPDDADLYRRTLAQETRRPSG